MRCAYFVPARRLFPACYREEVSGVELIRVELPRRKGAARRMLRRLARSGVDRSLNLPKLPVYPEPCPRLVETGTLYRRKAAGLALRALCRQGLTPEHSVVGLRGRCWTTDLARAAEELLPRVRSLALDLERPEEQRKGEQQLLERWGVSVLQGEGAVTVCFSPAQPGAGRLLLGGDRPEVEGLVWRWRGGTLPEDAAADALLALLLRLGRIGWEEAEWADG